MITDADIIKLSKVFATKKDLEQFATKKDLDVGTADLLELIIEFRKEMKTEFAETHKLLADILDDHKQRIEKLEDAVYH